MTKVLKDFEIRLSETRKSDLKWTSDDLIKCFKQLCKHWIFYLAHDEASKQDIFQCSVRLQKKTTQNNLFYLICKSLCWVPGDTPPSIEPTYKGIHKTSNFNFDYYTAIAPAQKWSSKYQNNNSTPNSTINVTIDVTIDDNWLPRLDKNDNNHHPLTFQTNKRILSSEKLLIAEYLEKLSTLSQYPIFREPNTIIDKKKLTETLAFNGTPQMRMSNSDYTVNLCASSSDMYVCVLHVYGIKKNNVPICYIGTSPTLLQRVFDAIKKVGFNVKGKYTIMCGDEELDPNNTLQECGLKINLINDIQIINITPKKIIKKVRKNID